MTTELVAYPTTDLAGSWELDQPSPIDGASFTASTTVGVSAAGYLGEDSASAAAVVGALSVPAGTAVDDWAFVVTLVTDETDTIELTGVDAPEVQGTDEVQTITSFETSGDFTLTFDGQTTGVIAWDASAATVQTALESLSNIAAGEAVCTGGDLGTAPVTVTFQLTLAATDVALMTTATDPYVAPVDEVQTLTSDRTGGTFTLTHDSNTTSALAWNSTAATVQAALEVLAHIDPGEAVCTGGPVGTADVAVTFQGALAGSPQAAITVDDALATGGTGMSIAETTAGVSEAGILIVETVAGVAVRPFTLRTSFNIPQAGNNYEPQIHVWQLKLVASDAGRLVDFTVADHGTLHSWVAGLLVERDLDGTTPLEDVGTESNGQGTLASWGSVTPSTAGSRVLAIFGKALAGANAVPASLPSAPPGLPVALQGESDAAVLSLFRSAVLQTATQAPGDVSWDSTEEWATGLLTMQPASPATAGASLSAVLDSDSLDDWVEIASVAGQMYEVVEVPLTGVPAGATIVGARLELKHLSSVRNTIRAVLVGISVDGTLIFPAKELGGGYTPDPVNQVQSVVSPTWSETDNGQQLSEFTRLGIALISSQRHPTLDTHKIYMARLRLTIEAGGPVVSNVVGPTTAGDPVTWDYTSDSGLPQQSFQVLVMAGNGADPDTATAAANPMAAAAGEIVYDSGRVAGDLDRSLLVDDAPIGRGDHTVAVRSWADVTSEQSIVSSWATDNFNITGSEPTPPAHGTDPSFDTATGGVDVEIDAPVGVTRAWLLRSVDSGATFALVDGNPYTISVSGVQTIVDFTAPPQSTTLRYAVVYDNGSMTETSASTPIGTGTDVSTPAPTWYLKVAADPSLNVAVEPRELSFDTPISVVEAQQPGNSAIATSLPLATRIEVSFWAKDSTVRAALVAVLESGEVITVEGVHEGERWHCRNVSGLSRVPQRWRPLATEAADIRDANTIGATLVEVTVHA